MRGPVETKVAAGGGAGTLLSLLFGLAAQYHWFAPPSPALTALAVTAASFLAGWLAPHTPLMLAAPVAPPGPERTVITVAGSVTPEQLAAVREALRKESLISPVASRRRHAAPPQPEPDGGGDGRGQERRP